jgi:hypothetical protein
MATTQATYKLLGTVSYTPSPGVNVKAQALGTTIEKKTDQFVEYEGKTYINAKEWIAIVFKNSGKSFQTKIELTIDKTPRPKKAYLPPTKKSPFAEFI